MSEHIKFNPGSCLDRQTALIEFSRSIKSIVRQEKPRTFNHEQLFIILIELAKNTFDHSTGVGMVDIKMPDAIAPLFVIYRDTGPEFDWKFSSAYRPSSKAGNGINFGMGLVLIASAAEGAGFDLDISRSDEFTEFKLAKRPGSVAAVG